MFLPVVKTFELIEKWFIKMESYYDIDQTGLSV